MDRTENDLLRAFLARRIDAAEDASHVADATASTWAAISHALQPIIGNGGVVGLYRRSLHLSADEHPWLGLDDTSTNALNADPRTLHASLAQRSTTEAQAAAASFLRHFDALLSSLIGPTLTARLLRPVWTDALGQLNEQDTTQ